MNLESEGFLTIDGVFLEYRWIVAKIPQRPTLIFLHEGLGCVGMWKDFPDQIAQATGCGALIYSRAGYGRSGPAQLPRSTQYMHHEGLVVLPELIETIGCQHSVLIGHSDGGSIALIHAGSGTDANLCGLVMLAPHVFVEKITIESIQKAGHLYKTTSLSEKLARYHGPQTEATFWGWQKAWVHPDFLHWNLEEYLPPIEIPTLVIQGANDAYGTLEQVKRIQNQVSGDCNVLVLSHCGHSPHIEQRAQTQAAMTDFINQCVAEN